MTLSVNKHIGVMAALGAAVLFGIGTPLTKLLLTTTNPIMLAGLLYLGAGIGLTIYRLLTGMSTAKLSLHDMFWFAGAVVCGGVIGPALLMLGLKAMPASGVSLLLNVEGVFTAFLAWFVFKENFDWRIALGMIAIVCGAVILSWPSQLKCTSIWPAWVILGACLVWGLAPWKTSWKKSTPY